MLSSHTLSRAVFTLIVIVVVLISSTFVFQRLKLVGQTEYDLSKSGSFYSYGSYGWSIISALAFDSNSQIWVGTDDTSDQGSVISMLAKDGTWKTYPLSDSKIPDGRVTSLAIDNDNNVWVGTRSGLEVLTPQGTWEKTLEEQVFALAVDLKGQLWAGMEGKLSQLSNGKWKDHTPQNSEVSEFTINALFVDQQGQVWMSDGFQIDILKPDGSWIKDVTKPNIPRFASIETLAIDKQNKLWVGTLQGLYVCNNGNCAKYTRINSGLGQIHMLAFDGENKLWTGYNIIDIDRLLSPSLLEWLLIIQWVENIILFVLVYFFVIRQIAKMNNYLIGALGGGLSALIAAVSPSDISSPEPLSFSTILVVVIGAGIGLIVSAVVRKISDKKIVAYVCSGLAPIIFYVCALLMVIC